MIPLKKMPVSEDSRGNQNIDFKQKYRNLKRKLKLLIYENECYSDELQKVQRQLLQVTRDKNFLLDQLINYENFNSTTSDSDATDSSDSETELGPVKLETPNNLKRKKPNEPGPSESPTPSTTGGKKKKANLTVNTSTAATNTVPTSLTPTSTPKIRSATPLTNSFAGTLAGISGQIKPRSAPAIPSSSKGSPSVCQIAPTAPIVAVKSEPQPTHLPAMLQSLRQTQTIAPKPASLLSIVTKNEGQLTSEEIERHFESRPLQASLLIPEKTPLTVPVELFSNESSTGLNNE